MNTWLWVLCLFVVYLVFAELWVVGFSRNPAPSAQIDYILVLGANGNEQSPVTFDRAQSAIAAAKLYPQAQVILTGKPEEVAAYRNLMSNAGLTKFIEEIASTTTWDNVRLSEVLMEPGKNVLLVTSEYHQPRALAMARSLKWNAWAFGKDARVYEMRFYFFVKERFSNGKYFLPMLLTWLFH